MSLTGCKTIGRKSNPVATARLSLFIGGTPLRSQAAVRSKTALENPSHCLVSPAYHLGGLSSGGLGLTDTGDKSVIVAGQRSFTRGLQH